MVTGKCTDVFTGIFLVGGGGEKLKGVTWEDLSMEECVMGEENFNERGAGFSSIIKKIMKNNFEKLFQMKVRSSIKN